MGRIGYLLMKISELIKSLEAKMIQYGDLDVVVGENLSLEESPKILVDPREPVVVKTYTCSVCHRQHGAEYFNERDNYIKVLVS